MLDIKNVTLLLIFYISPKFIIRALFILQCMSKVIIILLIFIFVLQLPKSYEKGINNTCQVK